MTNRSAHPPQPINWLSRDAVPAHVNADKIFKLSSNENPLGPSPAAIEAIRHHSITLGEYPPTRDTRLRQALADHYGAGLTSDHFFAANSGSEGLECIGRAFLQPGDECIICSPAFSVYNWVAGLQKAILVDVPLDPVWLTHRLDAILAAVTDRTRLIFLSNPHNPAGTIITADEMETLYTGLPDHVVVVSDEVYVHYVDRPDFPKTVSDVLANRNVIILHSFSKAFGLAGLRLGSGIARPDLIARMAPFHRTFHLGSMTIEAGIAALKDRAHLKKSVDMALQGKAWLYQQFARLGLATWPSEANFILVRLPAPAYETAVRLLEFGVIVMPQARNGLDNCIRVTVGTPEGNEAFIQALEKVLG